MEKGGLPIAFAVSSEKFMRSFFMVLLIALFLFSAMPVLGAEKDDQPKEAKNAFSVKKAPKEVVEKKPPVSNLPLNFYGRNGLIFTTSTHVLDYKDVEPGVGYMYEQGSDPKYTTQTIAVNVAAGLPHNFMVFLHAPIIITDLHYTERFTKYNQKVRDFEQKDKSGLGSIETGFQWAFFMQDRFLPGMSAGISLLAPTGDYTQQMSEVKYYGTKLNFAMSLEILDLFFTDYVFAILADGSLVLNDMGIDDQEYEEKHGEVHVGMIFPVHPRNFINLIFEYEGILLKGTTNEEDINGFLGGLRFNMSQFGVTAGAEYLNRQVSDMDNTIRYMGTGSFRFW